MEIKNKNIVITGGASGMGAACVEYFKKNGANCIVLDLNVDESSDLAFKCDVSDANSVEQAIKKAVKKVGELHALINCAGIATGARIVSKEGPMPLTEFSKVIQVNLIGTFNVMRIVAAQMMQQNPVDEDGERGVIINTASVAAFEGQVGQAAYSASKGGVVSLMLPAAREFSKFGIRVLTIAPGIISTPMMAKMPEKVQESLAEQMLFPKRLGEADEYAKLAQHIIENKYLNATVIRLDAGIRMQAK